MLQVVDISKEYRTGTLVQRALDHVSVAFRDSEFVAILGPSGSGKTTLLNIIGGLDRYDSGDLIINNVSTKKYRDRDWDSYRNHTIGFVFQSYNLIPHQTVLANVELALTISGISGAERRERAKEALEKVGLKDHIYKKPNQLSGGQMQRVAIARALVNDPDILLADEPTGALDSDTSVQVMDLLKEVASDRLVVMVTHNPELAEQYATRIVRLRDGKIIDDSDPFEPKEDRDAAAHRNLGRARMTFFTALALSFHNLKSKFTRTILIAFAGSIGIIGIALIMSLSNGVNLYIKAQEEETLKEYPLQITSFSFDMGSLLERNEDNDSENPDDGKVHEVREMQIVSSLFSTLTTNDLTSLKKYLDSRESHILDYSNAVEYSYAVSPLIYIEKENGYRQVNPDTLMASMGYTYSASGFASMFSQMGSTDVFHALPENEALYQDQYEVKAGRWPETYQECVLVLTGRGSITDVALYDLNMKETTELDTMISDFLAGKNVEIQESAREYRYEDFLGITFKLISACDCYSYDSEYRIFTDKREDRAFMNQLIESGEDLTIVGVVQPREDATVTMLTYGINYPASLTYHCMDRALQSEVVKAQMRDPETDVITGKAFGDTEHRTLDMASLFTVDEDAMKEAFSFDMDDLDMDFSGAFSGMDFTDLLSESDFELAVPEMDFASMLSGVQVNLSPDSMENLVSELMTAYTDFSENDPATSWSELPDSLQEYLETDEANAAISDAVSDLTQLYLSRTITEDEMRAFAGKILLGYQEYLKEQEVTDPEEANNLIDEYLASEQGTEAIREAVTALLQRAAETVVTPEELAPLREALLSGYETWAEENNAPRLSKMRESFRAFLETDQAAQIIRSAAEQAIDTSGLQTTLSRTIGGFVGSVSIQVSEMLTNAITAVSEKITGEMPKMFEEMFQKMGDSLNFDAEAFSKSVSMNFSDEELRELMSSLMSSEASSYSTNMQRFGYVSRDEPNSISIYPVDFDCKGEIKDILTRYNEKMEAQGEEEKVITYTDLVGTLMGAVTNIVDAISYVLIAFVAISLIVSSIMIGVITYISVLERKKEIGILRAIGASKRNISQVFNAETVIIGVLAGLIGVLITELLLIPANIILHKLTGQNIRAVLPLISGAGLVILSTGLTLLGGLIPAKKASRSDPVTALRTE